SGVDAEHLCRPSTTSGGALLGVGDDALVQQTAEDVGNGGAGEPQRLGDLPAGELPATMQQRQHVCTVLVPDAPLPVHAGDANGAVNRPGSGGGSESTGG